MPCRRDGRHAWVPVSFGELELGGHTLAPGDGAALSDEAAVGLPAVSAAHVLLCDLA